MSRSLRQFACEGALDVGLGGAVDAQILREMRERVAVTAHRVLAVDPSVPPILQDPLPAGSRCL